MAYKVIILYRLYMPSYVLGTFTEYPYIEVMNYSGTIFILFTASLASSHWTKRDCSAFDIGFA